jgi:hypothetical protein
VAKKKKKTSQKAPPAPTPGDLAPADLAPPKDEPVERTLAPPPASEEGSLLPAPSTVSMPPATTSLPPTQKSNLPPELAHDDREIDARTILRTGLFILGLTGIALVGAIYLTRGLVNNEDLGHAAPPPMASGLPDVPDLPRLQRLPAEGLEALREEEAAELEGYGWVDGKRGVVRIPIERAIDLVAERGLPVRPVAPPPRDVSRPTDASLGVRPVPSAKGGKP